MGKRFLVTVSRDSDGSQTQYEVDQLPIKLGRDVSNAVCVDHEVVSSFHAEIYENGDQLCVRDVGSTNGVFVAAGGRERRKLKRWDPQGLTEVSHEFFLASDFRVEVKTEGRLVAKSHTRAANQLGFGPMDSQYDRIPLQPSEVGPTPARSSMVGPEIRMRPRDLEGNGLPLPPIASEPERELELPELVPLEPSVAKPGVLPTRAFPNEEKSPELPPALPKDLELPLMPEVVSAEPMPPVKPDSGGETIVFSALSPEEAAFVGLKQLAEVLVPGTALVTKGEVVRFVQRLRDTLVPLIESQFVLRSQQLETLTEHQLKGVTSVSPLDRASTAQELAEMTMDFRKSAIDHTLELARTLKEEEVHQLALVEGAIAGMEKLRQQLSPESIAKGVDRRRGFLAGHGRYRDLWNEYCRRFEGPTEQSYWEGFAAGYKKSQRENL